MIIRNKNPLRQAKACLFACKEENTYMNLIKQKLKRIITLMLAVILSAVTLPCWAKAEEAVPVYTV